VAVCKRPASFSVQSRSFQDPLAACSNRSMVGMTLGGCWAMAWHRLALALSGEARSKVRTRLNHESCVVQTRIDRSILLAKVVVKKSEVTDGGIVRTDDIIQSVDTIKRAGEAIEVAVYDS
jgi:hypothetical protein